MAAKVTSSDSQTFGTFPRGEGTRCEMSTTFRGFVGIEGDRSMSRFSFGEAARRADEVLWTSYAIALLRRVGKGEIPK
jgi:hypothetical protein